MVTMAIEVFNRYELKYAVPASVLPAVLERIEQHMEKDAYNKNGELYTVSNIYFDTPDFDLIRTSLQKPAYKEKLRLRSYGACAADETAFLEIKKKYKGLVNKRRTKIRQGKAYAFVQTGKCAIEKGMNRQVLSELSYFVGCRPIEPKAYIAYDRLAYFEVGNPDLRASFDFNIRARSENLSLQQTDCDTCLIPHDISVMEIKTRYAMPIWLTKTLPDFHLHKTSFSKYGTFYKEYLLPEAEACVNV